MHPIGTLCIVLKDLHVQYENFKVSLSLCFLKSNLLIIRKKEWISVEKKLE